MDVPKTRPQNHPKPPKTTKTTPKLRHHANMKYLIRRLLLGSTDDSAISASEFSDLKQARKALSAGLAIEEKHEVLLKNYEDFEKEIVNAATESMLKRPGSYEDFRHYTARFNKRLINFLTASRLYIDHIKQHVGDIIPMSSEGKDKVQALCSDKYDKFLEYRFMEALRNYVQHCGFPVHYTSLPTYVADLDAPVRRLVYTIELFSEKNRLLEDKKFKPNLLEELDERVNLKHMIRKYVECLSHIQAGVRETVSGRLSEARRSLEGFRNRFKEQVQEQRTTLIAMAFDDDGNERERLYLLLDWDDIRIELSRKNQPLSNLSARYVSGEIWKA